MHRRGEDALFVWVAGCVPSDPAGRLLDRRFRAGAAGNLNPCRFAVQSLVLWPTRELTEQGAASCQRTATTTKPATAVLEAGQQRKAAKTVDVDEFVE